MLSSVIVDWLGLLLRWTHVMAGIMWIGTSFYFVWLDASLRRREEAKPGIAGESWMVHGGGFYLVEKYQVAPERLPEELHWFKYEAYFTWITGFLLLAVIYYWSAEAYLIDRSVLDISPAAAIGLSVASLAAGWLLYDGLCRSPVGRRTALLAAAVFILILLATWGYGAAFSGRAALLHVGALIGTMMAANVFMVIIPNQKKTVAALIAGQAPDPRLGDQAKQRSLHNNYLTLPVILTMIGNHYPLLYAEGRLVPVVAGVVLIGVLVRHFVNSLDSGKRDVSFNFLLPGAAVVLALLVWLTLYRPEAGEGPEAVAFAEVQSVVQLRCASCHSAKPTDEDFDAPPGEVAFDTPSDIKRHAQGIMTQAVLSQAMPLGNKTGMQESERALLGAWIRQGAPLD
ncbi:MAG: urate hydroxylase PuuD [Kiloniellales bacterium]